MGTSNFMISALHAPCFLVNLPAGQGNAEENHQTFRGTKQTIGLHDSNDAMGVET